MLAFYAAFWKLIKTSKISCNSILYLKIVISNKHAKPLIIKNFFSNHSFAAIQVFFFISRFQTSIHRYLCIRSQQFLTDNSIFKHTLKNNFFYFFFQESDHYIRCIITEFKKKFTVKLARYYQIIISTP